MVRKGAAEPEAKRRGIEGLENIEPGPAVLRSLYESGVGVDGSGGWAGAVAGDGVGEGDGSGDGSGDENRNRLGSGRVDGDEGEGGVERGGV